MSEARRHEALEWGMASRCRAGETISGDLAVFEPLPDGALVAVIDGLGHGEDAAHAAQTAGRVLRGDPGQELVQLLERCHQALAGTRGAAISMARLSSSQSSLSWLGVGNVEGRLLKAQPSPTDPAESLRLTSGLPGQQLPEMESTQIEIAPGDVLLLATDGVARGFADSQETTGTPEDIARQIIRDHRQAADDALVIATRYLGSKT